MKKKLKILAALLVSVAILGNFTACIKGEKINPDAVKINFWGMIDQYTSSIYNKLIDDYNQGQGAIDGVYVRKNLKSDYSSSLNTILRGSTVPDVVICSDNYFKSIAAQGNFYNLDEFISDESTYIKDADGNTYFDLNDIPHMLTDRFRYNKDENLAGAGQSLYAIPQGDNPQVMYYNATFFKDANIHIISVAEEDLAAYNAKNGTKYVPRGYAEYTPAATPMEGLATSTNLDGVTVVKVFNNQIPMSWNEHLTLSKYFTQSYRSSSPSKYGYLSEWWFQYGWSVGGDCMAWDEELNQNLFTLLETNPGYIVTKDVSINGATYKAGDVVDYQARKYIAEAGLSNEALMDSLYQIPSQYEAFRHFCALSQFTTQKVDSIFDGYAVSPSPATLNNVSKITYFTSGQVAMVNEAFSSSNAIGKAIGTKWEWDIAPLYQYKEYEGGEMTDSGTFKIIGDNGFTGEIKKVHGTKIKGLYKTASVSYGVAIPNNSSNKSAAWKFMQWFLTKGQTYLTNTTSLAPSNNSYLKGDYATNLSDAPFKNIGAVTFSVNNCDLGDWSYLEDGEWVHDWANVLNTDVRNGEMKLDEFKNRVQSDANIALEKYKVKLIGR